MRVSNFLAVATAAGAFSALPIAATAGNVQNNPSNAQQSQQANNKPQTQQRNQISNNNADALGNVHESMKSNEYITQRADPKIQELNAQSQAASRAGGYGGSNSQWGTSGVPPSHPAGGGSMDFKE